MAIIVHIVYPGMTADQYDSVRAETGWLEEAPTGGLSHVTWWEGDNCHIIDAWESEEAVNAFVENRLGPSMAAVGVDIQPELTFHPAHEVYTPVAVTRV